MKKEFGAECAPRQKWTDQPTADGNGNGNGNGNGKNSLAE